MSKLVRRVPFALLTAATVALAPVPASAHDSLVSTDPADGTTAKGVDRLELTFSGSISDLGTQVALTGGPGGTLIEGVPEVQGTKVIQPTVDLAPGDYEVVWRVTSEDGHPISGSFGFTVDDGTAAGSTSSDAAGTTAEVGAPPGVAGTESAAATGSVAQEVEDVVDEVEERQEQVPLWAWAAVGLATLALLGLLVQLLRTRSQRPR